VASIVEFLEARIAEDEADAKPTVELEDDDCRGWAIAYAERVLAECAAKRAIIEAFNPAAPDLDPYVGRDVMAMLAVVYKDHSDYNPEWSEA
jgi:hypothetical protein